MEYLIDTNIVSELRKPRPDDNVAGWFDATPDRYMYTSVIVLGELSRGIELKRRRDPVQARGLDDWYAEIDRWAGDRILPVTRTIAEEWARMNAPDRLPALDGYIAATARVHDLCVATGNVRDFARTGVKVLNPFDPRLPATPRHGASCGGGPPPAAPPPPAPHLRPA